MKIDSWLEFILLVLASFRLTRLLVFDKITKFIRDPFIEEFQMTEPSGEESTYIRVKGKGIRAFFGELLSCYWCTGVWCATVVVLAFFFIPYSNIVIIIFGVAGLGAIIEVFVNKWV
ncbi:MAG: DUF1360 domain-containing protein [Bacillaceae bacterium]